MKFIPLFFALLLSSRVEPELRAVTAADEVWENRAAPVLDRHCWKCHAGVRQKGGLDLRSLETILRGGESGPAAIPGKPEKSRLVEFVKENAETHMPPEGKKQLNLEEVSALRDWIRTLPEAPACSETNNAWVPEYLAKLRKSEKRRPAPPPEMPISAAIDAILKADWKEQKIKPAPLVDDPAFARRLYLDLIGRIPLASEMEAFLSSAPSSRERRLHLADSLLEHKEYPRHFREVFDVVLMGRPKKNNEAARQKNGWNDFLEFSFRTNQPWNEVVR
ncbi:MAG TPA: DUF1549 domain-containing protein, partial [Verrucomicrobiae bacterium]|nr:DUF1549 domain-containing protein [Verrucomicrobiae bacterium]